MSLTMRQIEEIPYGGEITKVLLFPRKPFRGIMRGNLVRIAEIDTSYFNISVAIIDKRQNAGSATTVATPTAESPGNTITAVTPRS
jgi:hypothetical protein